MAILLAAIVSIACVSASIVRLRIVARPTHVRFEDIADQLKRSPRASASMMHKVAQYKFPSGAGAESLEIESELLAACAEPDEETRAALVNEVLWSLEGRLRAWADVPRVAARISTTAGMLSATLVLRASLASDPASANLTARVAQAVAAVALGLAGGAFCYRAHREANRIAQAAARAADASVDALLCCFERQRSGEHGAEATGAPRP